VLREPNRHNAEAVRKADGPALHCGGREEAYARATLESLARELAAKLPDSGRNIELNNAAIRMGHMVAAGWIGRATVEGRLLDAATACGLIKDDGHPAAMATIKSGLDAGEKEPHGPLQDRDDYRQPSPAIAGESKPVYITDAAHLQWLDM
jgi:hypothetical protein